MPSTIHQTIISTANSSPPSSSLDHENLSPAHHHNLSPMPYTIHAQIPASIANQNSPPTSHIDSHDLSPQHNHHSLSPMPYTHQLPSPVNSHAPTNLIVNNSLHSTNKYMQSYMMQHQSNVDVHGMIVPTSFSPMHSPKYYGMSDHEVKLEPAHHQHHHHQQQQHQHHQHQHQLMHSQHHHQQVSTKYAIESVASYSIHSNQVHHDH